MFEDETLVCGVRYDHFKDGAIANPNLHKYQAVIDRASVINYTLKMNCGLYATCIRYGGCSDLDIEFENGDIVYNRSKTDFLRGEIACPSLPKYFANRRISLKGDINMMNCGILAEVIDDFGVDNITVRFSDGTIVEHRTRSNFRTGNISNPNFNQYSVEGLECIQNCGMSCKCIDFRSSTDIDVLFEDSTIIRGRTKAEFLNGTIQNPNLPKFNSLPQCYCFYFIKKYFPDALYNYRPDWLKSPITGNNFEIDIWIPSLKIGIEYDGYIKRHQGYNLNTAIKLNLINNYSGINKLFVIGERTTFDYNLDGKYNYFSLNYISKKSEYASLLDELSKYLEELLREFDVVDASVSPFEIDSLYNNFSYNRFLLRLKEKFM